MAEVDSEFDFLEANLHPFDLEARAIKGRILAEIDEEKMKIKIKYLDKYGRNENDPFRLWS
jgi:hypothetical protein